MSSIRRPTIGLIAALLSAGCVDVPDPAPSGGSIDAGDAGERPPDADTPDGAPPPDADTPDGPPDAAPIDMRPDVAWDPDAELPDATPDARLVDAAPDMQPDAQPDAQPDMQPDALPDMGEGMGPLAFSNCLRLSDEAADIPLGPLTPCLQVAVASPMPARLSWREGAALSDGRAVLVGGLRTEDGAGRASTRVDVYDPSTDRWSEGPALPFGRWGHGVARLDLDDGEAVAVIGGAGDTGGEPWSPRGEVLYWPVAQRQWASLGQAAMPAVAQGAVWSDGDSVWSIGGYDGPRGTPTAVAASWSVQGGRVAQGQLTEPRYGHAIVGYRGMPVVIGGANADQVALNAAEYPADDGWQRIGDDLLRRAHAEAVVVGDRILVAGGRSHALDFDAAGQLPPLRMSDTLTLGPVPGTGWVVRPGPSMYRARFAFGLAPIDDGRMVLAIGGEAVDPQQPAIVELYDPNGGQARWLPFDLPPPADKLRAHHTVIPLADGMVMVSGGVWGGAPAGSDELFMNQTLVFRLGRRNVAETP